MGSDLFGSFVEALCVALVISVFSSELASVGIVFFMFPLLVSAAGIVVCMLTSFVATHVQTVAAHKDVEGVLKVQLFVSALLMSLATLPLAYGFLPNKFTFNDLYEINTDPRPSAQICHWWGAWICVACGLWGGCLIGFITELTKQQQQKYSKKFTPEQVGTVQMVPHGKKTEVHKAAVVGDTVGDPLKDTSGPALNIVMKLMAILSLVFSDFFVSIN